MIRPMLSLALAVFLLAPFSIADTHTDAATGFSIEFPDRWEVEEADAVMASAPDHLGTILVIAIKNAKDAGEALQRLDRDDVMGNQIKTVRPDEKVISKNIGGMPAKIFTGTANVANVKMPFVAAVVQDGGPSFVVFAFPANNAHLKRMVTSIESIRGPKSGK
ncbi:MAG TPA: hypothetical protein VGQ99_11880 [Tepidisphaeraceae bacterium]|nr:hypothetical protein [Tepidisphaeraceae bacterium]